MVTYLLCSTVKEQHCVQMRIYLKKILFQDDSYCSFYTYCNCIPNELGSHEVKFILSNNCVCLRVMHFWKSEGCFREKLFAKISMTLVIQASPSPQEDETRAAGAQEEGCEELRPAVRRADLRPLPKAAGKVLELGRSVPRLQPPHLQQVPRGSGELEVHGLPRAQVEKQPAV